MTIDTNFFVTSWPAVLNTLFIWWLHMVSHRERRAAGLWAKRLTFRVWFWILVEHLAGVPFMVGGFIVVFLDSLIYWNPLSGGFEGRADAVLLPLAFLLVEVFCLWWVPRYLIRRQGTRRQQPQATDWVTVAAVTVVVGLFAAIGWSKFRALKARSENMAVIGNLRQIQAGADQYFLENGVSSVASTTIVGTAASQNVRSFVTVAQETYTPLIVQGQGISAMGVAGARTITFGP